MSDPTAPPPLDIGMVIFPGMTQLGFTGPYEVFARLSGARLHLLAATLAPVASHRGLVFQPEFAFADCPELDVLFVPGGPGQLPLMDDEPFLAFLRGQGERARWVTSVCTGSLLLGAAGLLRGYRATTHWLSLDQLALLGAVPVAERIVVDRNRITGGGVTAGIDFALALAARLRGRSTAETIQLALEYDPFPPFRSGSPGTADPALVATILRQTAERQAARRAAALRAAARLGLAPAPGTAPS